MADRKMEKFIHQVEPNCGIGHVPRLWGPQVISLPLHAQKTENILMWVWWPAFKMAPEDPHLLGFTLLCSLSHLMPGLVCVTNGT